MKNKLLTLFLALVTSVGILFAQSGTCGTNLTWTLNNGTLTISGTGAMTDYTYSPWDPDEFGYSVNSVVIEEGVTSIGKYAFSACSGLVSIEIPNSVTSIGDKAFYTCNKLSAVHISDISAWCKIAFSNSYANPLYCAHNLYLNGTLVTDLVIPDGVTSIKNYAFYGCTGLTSVTIPNSVTSIGQSAFYNCTGLTSVTIPNSVTSIGYMAFDYCSSLTSVTIPNSVTSIGIDAFRNCSSLTSVTIPNSVTVIQEGAFEDCSSLTAVHISDISAWCKIAFSNSYANPLYYAPNLYLNGTLVTDLVIPNSVTYIRENAFRHCSSLTSLTIPISVTGIGKNAFGGCYNLQSVIIGKGVQTIRESAFSYCHGLIEITCKALTPPSVYSEGFDGVDRSIPLYVPAQSFSAYRSKSPWNEFLLKTIEDGNATVVWKNYDGSVLETDNDVPYATRPEYNGATPTKPADEDNTYTFSGWTPAVVAVTGNTTYTATFQSVPFVKYTITWQDEDGNIINTDEVKQGTIPAFTGTTPTKDGYDFAGWLPNIKPAMEDTKYTTYFIPTQQAETPVYTVNINGENCSLNINNQYPEGTVITLEAVADECFEFQQWSDGNKDNPRTVTVTANTNLTAEFKKVRYTVTGQPSTGGKVQIRKQ